MADITGSFSGLPLGLLISQPIIEVAKGQSELCSVYLDYLFQLAYEKGDSTKAVRSIKFRLNRPIISPEGDSSIQQVEVEAPLLSLVPVPSFTMDEATVRFTMEVKEQNTDKSKNTFEENTEAGFSKWGFHANISGKVTTESENTRSTDQSAKYEIYARATQQPPAEGMAKLTSIFASVIEPIQTSG